jgi:hypothetical protein
LSSLLKEAAAKGCANERDDCHKAKKHDEKRRSLAIFEEMECGYDFEAEAARAHDPHSGGRAQIVLPAMDDHIGEARQNLLQD